jgi:hypothetical protein
MLTVAPLPKIKDILVAFFSHSVSDLELAESWCHAHDKPFWFSKSAWSLKIIILWWERFFKKKSPVIWFPDYFCNQSLALLRQTNAKIIFYPVDKNREPKWHVCEEMAASQKPDLFVLVHYFGIPSDLSAANRFCKKHQAMFIEDAVHVLHPVANIGLSGHFVLYSPHKLLPIPDGAVCIMRPKGVIGEGSHAQDVMKDIIKELGEKAPFVWPWILKRSTQKVIPFSISKTNHADFYSDEAIKNVDDKDLHMSSFSKKMLSKLIKNMDSMSFLRKTNADLWKFMLIKNDFNLTGLFDNSNNNVAPYLAVFSAGNAEDANKNYYDLMKKNHLVQTWPDLPPEVQSNQEKYKDAIDLRNTTLTLPVHHTLGLNKKIKRYFKRVGMSAGCYELTNEVLREKWEPLFAQIDKTNLLQSWGYGEAKSKAEGWLAKRHLVLNNNKPIAMLQVLSKKLFWFEVLRINRGPLWLLGDVSDENKKAVYTLIKKRVGFLKGRVLFIAPELKDDSVERVFLKALGFYKRAKPSWQSTWINLAKTTDELRCGLDGKWRNQLKKSESYKLELRCGSSDDMFNWVVKNHQNLQEQKNFCGISNAILGELRSNLASSNFLILQALHDGIILSSIVVCVHGTSATYLVGCNTEGGRKLYANNFLLWQAILELKKRNCKWLDLGGVDSENTSSIAKFKQGLSGKEYSLIGEYWYI